MGLLRYQNMVVDVPYSHEELKETINNQKDEKIDIKISGTAKLPSIHGNFLIFSFENGVRGFNHIALIKGKIMNQNGVLTRIHSECLTGDALGSLRCDCKAQLVKSMEIIEEEGSGIIIYLRQEGRGIGIHNKVKAYELQDHGLNTYEANNALGFDSDLRDYIFAANVLKLLNIDNIKLMTNNPKKLTNLQKHGITIDERIELIVGENQYNKKYLEAKKEIGSHLLEPDKKDIENFPKQSK